MRAWASLQFLSSQPELGLASFSGLGTELSAQEVLALARRAQQAPPSLPRLVEMSTEALVAQFEDAAWREYGTRFVANDDPTDMTLYNRIVGEILDIMRELKRRDALAALLPLLNSGNITVRKEAAIATLTVSPQRASATLDAIVASKNRRELLSAASALDRWRDGKTVVFGVG